MHACRSLLRTQTRLIIIPQQHGHVFCKEEMIEAGGARLFATFIYYYFYCLRAAWKYSWADWWHHPSRNPQQRERERLSNELTSASRARIRINFLRVCVYYVRDERNLRAEKPFFNHAGRACRRHRLAQSKSGCYIKSEGGVRVARRSIAWLQVPGRANGTRWLDLFGPGKYTYT